MRSASRLSQHHVWSQAHRPACADRFQTQTARKHFAFDPHNTFRRGCQTDCVAREQFKRACGDPPSKSSAPRNLSFNVIQPRQTVRHNFHRSNARPACLRHVHQPPRSACFASFQEQVEVPAKRIGGGGGVFEECEAWHGNRGITRKRKRTLANSRCQTEFQLQARSAAPAVWACDALRGEHFHP